jgi:thiamine-monophosphate kinase
MSLPPSGEFDFIDWIRAQTARFDHVLVGPGDDLAVLKWRADDLLIVGVDQILDGVHFDSNIHSPTDIGRKVINRNLSDCAAMACLPAAAVATVALPRDRGIDYAKQLFMGMKSASDAFGFPVIGGDTGSWDGKLAMTVTILGRSDGIEPIKRSGAKVGDGIYVTGPLGGSILGRHMTFTPRVRLAREIARRGDASAMIDLSDGLSRDLRHICRESGVGAVIDAKRIPIHEDAIILSRQDGRSPLEHALHDGEDYELLYTSASSVFAERIGEIVAGSGVLLSTDAGLIPLEPKGWEHRL